MYPFWIRLVGSIHQFRELSIAELLQRRLNKKQEDPFPIAEHHEPARVKSNANGMPFFTPAKLRSKVNLGRQTGSFALPSIDNSSSKH